MLHATDPQTGERLSDENVRYHMVTFLIAGHETTSGLLSFTLYELLRHREVVKRARAEVERVLGAKRASARRRLLLKRQKQCHQYGVMSNGKRLLTVTPRHVNSVWSKNQAPF